MKYLHPYLIFILCALFAAGCAKQNPNEAALRQLDQAVAQSDRYFAAKDTTISQLRRQLAQAQWPEEKYWLNKQLYDAYRDYNADSASAYVLKNYKSALRLDKLEDAYLWKLRQAEAEIYTGNIDRATTILSEVPYPDVSDDVKMHYFSCMTLLSHIYSSYIEEMGNERDGRSRYYYESLSYRDSTLKYLHPDHPEYLNIKAWQTMGSENVDSILPLLKKYVDHSPLNTAPDALAAYNLSAIYNQKRMPAEHLHYLIMSALAYVRSANRNYYSETFEELGHILFNDGDLDRAYTYINFCADNRRAYNNRMAIPRVAKEQASIRTAYTARSERSRRIIILFLVISCALALGLIIAVAVVVRQARRVHRSRLDLARTNRRLDDNLHEKDSLNRRLEHAIGELGHSNMQLSQANAALEQVNNQLREANCVKEEYIGYAFTLSSSFIDKLEAFRKATLRKLRAGTREELQDFLTSPSIVQDELKEFHRNFDKTFLSLYPDFVDHLNALIKPQERITLRDPKRLNTDLRILALMRLGITSCEKIADFLHCSVQSVYNSRRGMYARLAVSPKEFKALILNLGQCSEPLDGSDTDITPKDPEIEA